MGILQHPLTRITAILYSILVIISYGGVSADRIQVNRARRIAKSATSGELVEVTHAMR